MSPNPYRVEGPALISFSGGRTSAFMLWKILEAHGGTLPENVVVGFANTGREMPETLNFVQECSDRWNVPIVWLEYDPEAEHKTRIVSHNSASRNGEPFAALIGAKNYLPNPVTRFCTIEMKIRRFHEYCHKFLGWKHWNNVVGLRADEKKRVERARNRNSAGKERFKTITPLAEANVNKGDVTAFWADQPFDLRLENVKGSTPMGNCDLCFLKGEKTLKVIVRSRPETASWWIEQERRVASTQRKDSGCLFRKDRPSYAQLKEIALSQGNFFDDIGGDDESIDCNCTD